VTGNGAARGEARTPAGADAVRRYLAGEDLDYAQLYEAGVSASRIGELMGVSASQMQRLLRAAGVRMRPWGAERIVLSDVEAAEAARRYRQGAALAAIAKDLRRPVGAVRVAVAGAADAAGAPRYGGDRWRADLGHSHRRPWWVEPRRRDRLHRRGRRRPGRVGRPGGRPAGAAPR
jgi:hypothetical protein